MIASRARSNAIGSDRRVWGGMISSRRIPLPSLMALRLPLLRLRSRHPLFPPRGHRSEWINLARLSSKWERFSLDLARTRRFAGSRSVEALEPDSRASVPVRSIGGQCGQSYAANAHCYSLARLRYAIPDPEQRDLSRSRWGT